MNQDLAVRMLRGRGYDADVASDGREALAALADTRYDAVFMDCRMPTLDGLQATRDLRRLQGPNARIPVIALTASAMGGDRDSCLAAGMDDYLSKPIMLDELDRVLARWIPLSERSPTHARPAAQRQSSSVVDVDEGIIAGLRGLREGALAALVDLFAAETPAALDELAAAVAAGDAARVEQVAHRIKGGAASLGARRFAALADDLEQRAATGSLEGCAELVDALREALFGACVGLRACSRGG